MQTTTYDYIIVGAGSAGSTLATRLSDDGRHTVLLLEAGGPANNINLKIPLMVAKILNDERYTWQYQTEPQGHLNNKPQRWVRGRVIGGSGSINGNLFVRGDPKEYDDWRDQGCKGWGYSDMLPYFRKLEDYPEGDQKVRGSGGPIHCTNLNGFDPLSDAFVAACGEAARRRGGQRGSDFPLHRRWQTRRWKPTTTSNYRNTASAALRIRPLRTSLYCSFMKTPIRPGRNWGSIFSMR